MAATTPKRDYSVKGTYSTQTCHKESQGTEYLGLLIKGVEECVSVASSAEMHSKKSLLLPQSYCYLSALEAAVLEHLRNPLE